MQSLRHSQPAQMNLLRARNKPGCCRQINDATRITVQQPIIGQIQGHQPPTVNLFCIISARMGSIFRSFVSIRRPTVYYEQVAAFFERCWTSLLLFPMAKRLSLGDILRPISGSNAAAVFIESPIKDVVAAIFNAPMATINGENSLCVGVLCRLAGDAV